MTDFDIEARWPELFADLTAEQRSAVINTLASSWHEGWKPNREDVEDLTLRASGAISKHEYERRTDQRVAERRVTQERRRRCNGDDAGSC